LAKKTAKALIKEEKPLRLKINLKIEISKDIKTKISAGQKAKDLLFWLFLWPGPKGVDVWRKRRYAAGQ